MSFFRFNESKSYDHQGHDGSEAEYPVTFQRGFSSIARNGRIVFVYPDETWDYGSEYTLTISKKGLTIIGKNSTFINITFDVTSYASDFNISGLNFMNNRNSSIIISKGADNCNISNCTFKDNGGYTLIGGKYTGFSGTAINVCGENLTVVDSRFENNHAGADNALGGAILCNASGLNISDCNFTNNDAYSGGNHIYLTNNAIDAYIAGSRFLNSTFNPLGLGSAIIVKSNFVTIEDNVFENNTAVDGGALLIDSQIGFITLSGNNFTINKATHDGGAVYYLSGSNMLLDESNTFTENIALGNGGAIYSDIVLNNVSGKFISNSAVDGGAVYANNDLSIVGGEFISNSASGNGGALYLNGRNNIVDSVVFRSNSAVEGSAIYLCDNEALTLKKVTLEGNVNSGSSSGSGFCTIHVGDYAKINIPGDDLTRGGDQHIHLNNKYLTDILYVNSVVLGDGSGLTTSDAGVLTDDLLSNLNDGGKVVFLNDGSVYSLSPVNISNLNNIVFVGNSTTVQISENKKYLFNQPKNAKNKKKLCKNISFQSIIYPPI